MPISRDDDQYLAKAASAGFGDNSSDPYATGKLILQCIRCNAPVEGVICGRKSPCPSCGFPYPLGDCSDLAEN